MSVYWKHNGQDDHEDFPRQPSETDNALSARVADALRYKLTTIGREPDYGSPVTIEWHPKG